MCYGMSCMCSVSTPENSNCTVNTLCSLCGDICTARDYIVYDFHADESLGLIHRACIILVKNLIFCSSYFKWIWQLAWCPPSGIICNICTDTNSTEWKTSATPRFISLRNIYRNNMQDSCFCVTHVISSEEADYSTLSTKLKFCNQGHWFSQSSYKLVNMQSGLLLILYFLFWILLSSNTNELLNLRIYNKRWLLQMYRLPLQNHNSWV